MSCTGSFAWCCREGRTNSRPGYWDLLKNKDMGAFELVHAQPAALDFSCCWCLQGPEYKIPDKHQSPSEGAAGVFLLASLTMLALQQHSRWKNDNCWFTWSLYPWHGLAKVIYPSNKVSKMQRKGDVFFFFSLWRPLGLWVMDWMNKGKENCITFHSVSSPLGIRISSSLSSIL